MRNSLRFPWIVVLLLTLALTTPALARSAAPGPGPLSADAALAEVNRAVPGFGGMYVDEAGVVNVWVRDPGTAPMGTLKRYFGEAVRLHRGDYDFAQLAAWRNRARPVLAVAGVVLLDVDERTNRVRVGVAEGANARRAARAVRREMNRRGVPAAAVEIAQDRTRGVDAKFVVRLVGLGGDPPGTRPGLLDGLEPLW